MTVTWQDPPDKVLAGSRSAPHRDGIAAQVAEQVSAMRGRPGVWCLVSTGNRGSMNTRTQMIRAGAYGFSPPARWQVVCGAVDPELGPEVFGVWARYLPDAAAATAAAVRATGPAAPPWRPAAGPTTRGPVSRLPAAADLQLLCECGHARRRHPDGRGVYTGVCRRTGCDCGGFLDPAATT